ncbi:hypothetical protein EDB86DRAFT_2076405 [Lactarius hatsudake]|nr:hypothetical protein EDB86DRAFT_2076405 [Lactarius hatsudake]
MSAMSSLLGLPDEVILSIAVKLALADLASCLLSCRRLSVLISESSLMQYLIRTMLHGLHDPLISDMSIPERVKALDAWEKAWIELSVSNEPFQRHELSAVGLDPKKCIVQSGVLVGTQFNGIRLAGGYCYLDVLHLLNGSKSVGRFSIPNLGGDIYVQSYTYAPENDLIVIMYHTHGRRGIPWAQFHHFSTSDWHPSAAKHCLEFDQLWNVQGTCMECCGDNMVVILDAQKIGDPLPGVYVFLVEWKIGRITQLRRARPGTYGTVVTFLSPDTLAFALRDTFELELCKLVLPVAGGDAAPSLKTVSILKLPSLINGQQISDIRLSQPSPLSGTHEASGRSSLAALPFRRNPEDDILAFDIFFHTDQGRRIIFVARRRTLLALAAKPQTWVSATAWEDWGPRATHWLELDPQNDSLSLAGSRCVLVKYSHLRDHSVLDLRDFNPHRVRAQRPAPAVTVLSAQECFEEDVRCELPFVSLRKENVGSRVWLDDEWMAEVLWDPDLQSQAIHFRAIASPAQELASPG